MSRAYDAFQRWFAPFAGWGNGTASLPLPPSPPPSDQCDFCDLAGQAAEEWAEGYQQCADDLATALAERDEAQAEAAKLRKSRDAWRAIAVAWQHECRAAEARVRERVHYARATPPRCARAWWQK